MSRDITSELWLKIDTLHLNYLQADENLAKLEIRKKLEAFVAEYLCLVPQDRKFVSVTTGDIILNSARWIPGFSPIKASKAFQAIEQYAANLINQPWRQEFWTIKQYSGFYKHSVQSSLSGAEKLFFDMGYRETGPDCLELSDSRQAGGSPVKADAATSVARDCILAFVECKILADIHTGVSAQFHISWEELLEFRKDHVGTAEKAVQELIYRKNQAQYGGAALPWEGAPPPAGYGLNPGFLPPGYPGLPGYMPQFPLQGGGFPPGVNPAIPSHIDQIKAAQAAQQFHNGGGATQFHNGSAPFQNGQFQNGGGQPIHNGIAMHNGGFPQPGGSGGHAMAGNGHAMGGNGHAMGANGFRMNGVDGHVPTGRLVELDQDKVAQSPPGSSTSTLRQGQIPTTILELTGEGARRAEGREEKRNGRGHHGRGGARGRDSGEQIDNWDFVYKKLDADGYNKDQAERPDILNQQGKNRESGRGRNNQETPTSLGRVYTSTDGLETDEEVMKNMTSLRLTGKMESGRQMGRQAEGRRDTSESEQDASKYDSAVSQDKYSSSVSQEDARDRNRQQRNGQRETPQRAARGSGQAHQQRGAGHNQRKPSEDSNFWECSTCTFHNSGDKSICEMCGKTMDQPAAVRNTQIDMVQNDDGGLTCDKCTLLNEEGAKICEACGATLGMVYSPIRPARKNSWESMRRNSRQEYEFPPL